MNKAGDQQDPLFPMPLSSMEKFHLLDSSQQFPNEIFGRLRFHGRLDKDAAIAAVGQAVQRQPFLQVRLIQDGNHFQWDSDGSNDPPIVFQDIDDTTIPEIDLSRDYPWRVIFRTGQDRTEVWFQSSHALFDGLGAIQAITNWSNFYHQVKSPDSKVKRLHRLDDQLLRKRNSLGLTKRSYLSNLWKQPLGLFGAAKFVLRRPAEVYPRDANEKGGAWSHRLQPSAIGVWLDPQVVAELKTQANCLQISLNSIFVGQLMKTLEKFAAENPGRKSKWIRVIHPMSIRTIADRKLPTCNRATIVQIDRQKKEFDDDQFFQSLDREIGIIHKWELGKLFLLAIRALSLFPAMLRRAAQDDKCRGTAVYANLGEPLGRLGLPVNGQDVEVGDLRLEDFDFVGPIRSKTPVNFSVQKHLERYRLSLHYDVRVMNEQQASQLLEQYQSSLIEIARRDSNC